MDLAMVDVDGGSGGGCGSGWFGFWIWNLDFVCVFWVSVWVLGFVWVWVWLSAVGGARLIGEGFLVVICGCYGWWCGWLWWLFWLLVVVSVCWYGFFVLRLILSGFVLIWRKTWRMKFMFWVRGFWVWHFSRLEVWWFFWVGFLMWVWVWWFFHVLEVSVEDKDFVWNFALF